MYFKKAMPIWIKNEETTLNSICVFSLRFEKISDAVLTVAACNEYKIYLNGTFLAFGPSRAAHGYFRAEQIQLSGLQDTNVLWIEVACYNTNNYCTLNQPAFIQAELSSDGVPLHWTGKDFCGRIYTERLRKVSRFSLQRAFTESYVFCENPQDTYTHFLNETMPLTIESKSRRLLGSNLSCPKYNMICGQFAEKGTFEQHNGAPVRQFGMTFETLRIFSPQEWETNPSDYVCNLAYHKTDRCKADSLRENSYMVFDFKTAETGFIGLEAEVAEDAHIYIVFDETDMNESGSGAMRIDPYRNDCVNIIEYRLQAGRTYRHFSFEPYTARFVKVLVRSGALNHLKISMMQYENSDTDRFLFETSDKKLNLIVEAACRTFRHNAVDILMDCPSRERAGWLCDSFFSGRAELLLTGENKVETAFLENYAMYQGIPSVPENMIPMCYPSDFALPESMQCFIPNWSLWYIVELYDYCLRTDTVLMAEKSRNQVYGIFNYFQKFLNEVGLLENLEGWIFVEWSKANDPEFTAGINFPSNMMYAKALECAGILYSDGALLQQAEAVREQIRRLSFNGEYFEDNRVRKDGKPVLCGHISETCQYYAFFTGTATPKLYPKLFNHLVENFGALRDAETQFPNVHKSNAFVGNYLRLMLLADTEQKTRIRRESVDFFCKMAERTGTLWENDNPCASLDHGFTSYVANLLVGYVSGIVGIHGKTVLMTDAAEAIDCRICIPVPNGEIVFERSGGAERFILPEGYHTVQKSEEDF